MNPSQCAAILLAGGSGFRFSSQSGDKTLAEVGGKPVILYSLEAFALCKTVNRLAIVFRDETQKDQIASLIPDSGLESIYWARGGAARQDSVWSGLNVLPADTGVVLIHDGARPLIAAETIDKVAEAALKSGAATVARPATDTIKNASSASGGYLLETLPRDRIWLMETPQAFKLNLIRDGYRSVMDANQSVTDDLSAIESMSIPVTLVQNPGPNPKLTTPEDLEYIQFLISRGPDESGRE